MSPPDNPLNVRVTPLSSQHAEKISRQASSSKKGFEQVVGKISVNLDGKTTFLDVVWHGEEAESPAEEQIQEMAKALFETMQESKENLNPLSSSIEVRYKKYFQEDTAKRKYELLSAKFINPDKEIKMSKEEKQKLQTLKQDKGKEYKKLKKEGRYKELPTFALVDKIIRKILYEASRFEFKNIQESEEEGPPETEEERMLREITTEGTITETTPLKNNSQIEKAIIEAAETNQEIQNTKRGIFNKLIPTDLTSLTKSIQQYELEEKTLQNLAQEIDEIIFKKNIFQDFQSYKNSIQQCKEKLAQLEQQLSGQDTTNFSITKNKLLKVINEKITNIKEQLDPNEYRKFEKAWTKLLKEHLIPDIKKDLKNPTVEAIYEALKTPEKEFIKVTTIKETNLTTNVSLTSTETEEKITEDEFKKISEKTEGTIEEKTEKNENGNEIKLTTEIQVKDKTPPNKYIEQFQNALPLAITPQFPYNIEEN